MTISVPPGAHVRIVAPPSMLPQTLVAFRRCTGKLIDWEDECAVVQFGNDTVVVAAAHLAVAGANGAPGKS